jgi:glycosyltransferase involved in cell wall biosynthesis
MPDGIRRSVARFGALWKQPVQSVVTPNVSPPVSGDDRCGVLARPGAPEALAGAPHMVLTDNRIYQHLRSNARSRVLGHFRLEQAMFAYNNIYYALMAKAGQAGYPQAMAR